MVPQYQADFLSAIASLPILATAIADARMGTSLMRCAISALASNAASQVQPGNGDPRTTGAKKERVA